MTITETYWNDYCRTIKLEDVKYKGAFQFGEMADWLASLVVEGKKTATCSSYPLYDLENEPLPTAGDYYIVLDGKVDIV